MSGWSRGRRGNSGLRALPLREERGTGSLDLAVCVRTKKYLTGIPNIYMVTAVNVCSIPSRERVALSSLLERVPMPLRSRFCRLTLPELNHETPAPVESTRTSRSCLSGRMTPTGT